MRRCLRGMQWRTSGSAARSVQGRKARAGSDGSLKSERGDCLNLGTVNLVVGRDE